MGHSGWARRVSQWTGLQGVVGFYVTVGGLCMLAMCLLTPPFQVPDEPQHFYRSYQLSRLEIRPEVVDGRAGGTLPDSLPALVEQQLGTLEHHQLERRIPQRTLSETLTALDTPLAASQQRFVEFTGAALYAPSGYVPQALAMAAGRAAGFGPLGLLYAGRCANALATLALTAWALSLLSTGRLFAMVVAMLPMTQFMTASLSPDALTIAGGFVVAGCLQRFVDTGRWQSAQQVVWLGAGLLLCGVKVVYLPVLLAGVVGLLDAPPGQALARRRAVAWQAVGATLVVLLIAAWFWGRAPAPLHGGNPPGVDAAAQLGHLREAWTRPLWIALHSFHVHGAFLWETMVGRLGWLTVTLPPMLQVMAALALALSLLQPSAQARPGPAASLLVLACVAVSAGLIQLALYVAWTPVGADSARGVQGRYLTPLLPLAGLALAWRTAGLTPAGAARGVSLVVQTLVLLLSAGTLATLAVSYSLF